MLNLQRESRPVEELKHQGTLVLIGGAEDKKGDKKILRRFVELAGGSDARILVLATATRKTHEAGVRYCTLFRELGAKEALELPIYTRLDANNIKYVRYMSEVTGVFFTGGNQITLTSILGGTQFLRALQDAYVRGATIAGTSAGASAISRHMIMTGAKGVSPTKGMASIAAGLDLLHNMVVDQHFGARRRIGRLLTVVAHNPFLLGVGIDEDTAIIISPDNNLEVIGRRSVTILDGTNISYSNVSYVEGNQMPLCIYDVKMHLLLEGCTFDILRRIPMTPPAAFD
ncbi:MAG TPA: cyanophycinase [Candidatus Xenobia bacterium]|jgi:cyanophycinase